MTTPVPLHQGSGNIPEDRQEEKNQRMWGNSMKYLLDITISHNNSCGYLYKTFTRVSQVKIPAWTGEDISGPSS